MINQTDSFILSSFREFFQTLIIEKAEALSFDFKQSSAPIKGEQDLATTQEPTPTQAKDRPLFSSISGKLKDLFDQQFQRAHQQGGSVLEAYYKRAQYIMVALADEVFINLNWSEQETWENNLLETKFFNSHHAGTAIFQQVEAILKENDTTAKEIAQILFWTLGAGFEGKYRDTEDKEPLQKYKESLYKFITSDKPTPIEFSKRKICTQAYQASENKTIRYLPSPRIYILAILSILVIYFILSIFVWNQETELLRENISLIHDLASSERGSL